MTAMLLLQACDYHCDVPRCVYVVTATIRATTYCCCVYYVLSHIVLFRMVVASTVDCFALHTILDHEIERAPVTASALGHSIHHMMHCSCAKAELRSVAVALSVPRRWHPGPAWPPSEPSVKQAYPSHASPQGRVLPML